MATRSVRAVSEVIGWVTKNLLSQDSPRFGRYVKHWVRVVGYGPVLFFG
jgi:hypothetical protein